MYTSYLITFCNCSILFFNWLFSVINWSFCCIILVCCSFRESLNNSSLPLFISPAIACLISDTSLLVKYGILDKRILSNSSALDLTTSSRFLEILNFSSTIFQTSLAVLISCSCLFNCSFCFINSLWFSKEFIPLSPTFLLLQQENLIY